MGGRAAEETALGHMTTGAGNDIERATELARKMVCEWGMSDALGPLAFGKKEEQIFLGREIAQHRDYSESTAIEIDREVRRMVTENYDRAKSLLKEHFHVLKALAEDLLERETLDSAQIDEVITRASTRPAAGVSSEEPAPPPRLDAFHPRLGPLAPRPLRPSPGDGDPERHS